MVLNYIQYSYLLSQHIFISRNFIKHQNFLLSEIFAFLTQVEKKTFPSWEHEEWWNDYDENSKERDCHNPKHCPIVNLVVRVRVTEIGGESKWREELSWRKWWLIILCSHIRDWSDEIIILRKLKFPKPEGLSLRF